MVLVFGVPAAIVLGLLPWPRLWKVVGLWAVWFTLLALQTAYLAHPGRTGFFGVDGMRAVQGANPVYWLSQPLLAALLLAIVLGIDHRRGRRRRQLTPAAP